MSDYTEQSHDLAAEALLSLAYEQRFQAQLDLAEAHLSLGKHRRMLERAQDQLDKAESLEASAKALGLDASNNRDVRWPRSLPKDRLPTPDEIEQAFEACGAVLPAKNIFASPDGRVTLLRERGEWVEQ